MKPYGNTRAENQTCKYGCCSHGTLHKVPGTHVRVIPAAYRRSRKRARREARAAIALEQA